MNIGSAANLANSLGSQLTMWTVTYNRLLCKGPSNIKGSYWTISYWPLKKVRCQWWRDLVAGGFLGFPG